MNIDRRQRRGRRWSGGAVRVATFFALLAGCGASRAAQAAASGPPTASVAQSASDDPCRVFTADAMGQAFGRAMKSAKLGNVCEYRGPGTDRVVVKVAAGPEGTILRHAKAVSAQGDKAVEKVTTAVGEAYLDSTIPVFIGRVGDHEVQIETTIEPLPRDAMIATGRRIMETLARR